MQAASEPGSLSQGAALAAVSFAVITLVVFAPVLSPEIVFYERDIASYWYPHIESIVRAVVIERSWPVWNPYVSFGMPMWENPNFSMLYPFTWLNFVLLPGMYYKVFALGHYWLAAVGLYALLRALGMNRPAAFVGGAVWCLSGPFVSCVSLFHHYASAAWISWVVFGLVRLLQRPTVANALGLGAFAGLLALAGSADVAVMTAALCVAVLVGLWPGIDIRRLARPLGLAVVFAAALAAVQWLPTFYYIQDTARRALPVSHNLYWSVHPASLVDLIVPRLLADTPWTLAARAVLFESREPFLTSLYLGAPACALVALALFQRRDRLRVVIALLFFVLVFVSLGRHAPGLPWLLAAGPAVPLRYPVKALIAAAALWAVLCGAGIQMWRREWGRRERYGALAATIVMAGLALAAWMAARAVAGGALEGLLQEGLTTLVDTAIFRLHVTAIGAALSAVALVVRITAERTRGWTAPLLVFLVLADLAAVARTTNYVGPRALMATPPPILAYLGRPLDHTRIWTVRPVTTNPLDGIAPSEDGHVRAIWAAIERLDPPSAARWRLSGSFDGDSAGLMPQAIVLMSQVLDQAGDRPPAVRLLEIGAVDYLLALIPFHSPGLEPIITLPSAVRKDPLYLFRVRNPLPRAYVVGRSRVVSDVRDAVRQLLAPEFEPRREIILDSGEAAQSPAPFQGTARIVERTSRRVVMEVETSGPGYAVLVESYVRGWRATVDGVPAPVLRANAAFRAVRVPSGRHRVEMSYFPSSIAAGALITAAALLAAVAWWARSRARSAA